MSFQTARSYFYQFQRVREELASRTKIYHINFQMIKILRIYWEIGVDPLISKIKLEERALTKRVMLSVIISICNSLGFAAPHVFEGRKIIQIFCEQNVQ